MKPTKIDHVKCISCNKCIEVCIGGHIAKEEGKVQIMETECSDCGHCIAICPVDAIDSQEIAIPVDKINIQEKSLINLLKSRRSTRVYKKDKISREIIEKLIDTACYAPSGCNCQSWEFSIVTQEATLKEIIGMTARFYKGVVKMSGPDVPAKERPIKNETVVEVLKRLVEDLENGNDTLFYNAPALVVVHADKNSITPQDNCCYALYNMVILAHSMGIGSCINGLITNAMNGYKVMRDRLGIPDQNLTYAASTFGHEFQRIPKRKDAIVKWF